jgi:vacuolar-type H+-ATPase subunit E/Vma4
MITVDDKVNIFKNRVLDVRIKALEKLKKELKRNEEASLESEKSKLLEEQQSYENILIKSHLEDQQKRLQNAKETKNEMIYNKREEIMNHLIKAIEVEIKAFIQTKAYEDYILKLLEKHLDQLKEMAPISLYENSKISRNLSESVRAFLDHNGVSFFGQEEDEKISLGGVIIYNDMKNVRLDLSIDQAFKKEEASIIKLIKTKIEKEGD